MSSLRYLAEPSHVNYTSQNSAIIHIQLLYITYVKKLYTTVNTTQIYFIFTYIPCSISVVIFVLFFNLFNPVWGKQRIGLDTLFQHVVNNRQSTTKVIHETVGEIYSISSRYCCQKIAKSSYVQGIKQTIKLNDAND